MNKARKSVRQRLLDASKKNGGYRAGMFRHYLLEWNVGLHHTDNSREAVLDYAVRIGEMHLEDDAPVFWNGDVEESKAAEAERDALNWSDIFKTASPVVFARHGMVQDPLTWPVKSRKVCPNYPYFDVEFFVSGKHLLIKRFEGQDLANQDRVERILASLEDDDYGVLSNERARQLLAMIEEWDHCFTPEKASDTVMSNMACVYAERCHEWHTENDERQAWADRDVVTV